MACSVCTEPPPALQVIRWYPWMSSFLPQSQQLLDAGMSHSNLIIVAKRKLYCESATCDEDGTADTQAPARLPDNEGKRALFELFKR